MRSHWKTQRSSATHQPPSKTLLGWARAGQEVCGLGCAPSKSGQLCRGVLLSEESQHEAVASAWDSLFFLLGKRSTVLLHRQMLCWKGALSQGTAMAEQ